MCASFIAANLQKLLFESLNQQYALLCRARSEELGTEVVPVVVGHDRGEPALELRHEVDN